MIDWDNPLWSILIIVILISSLVVAITLIIASIDYNLHNYPIEITKDGVIIYDGIKSCVDIDSSGDTTTISINKGFLCLFPKATIVGKNIEVLTK